MATREGRRSNKEENLLNFRTPIGQYPIRLGLYEDVFLNYFQVCPYAQKLTFDWPKISNELVAIRPNRTVPKWSCSNYHKCDFKTHCRAPYRLVNGTRKLYSLKDRDYTHFPPELSIAPPEHLIQVLAIGNASVNCKKKVLVSPERFELARSKKEYTPGQAANLAGVPRQTIYNYESAMKKPRQKLGCIAEANHMITMPYALCYYFAVLYEVTPGYLMGQSDCPAEDIFVNKVSYYRAEDFAQKGSKSALAVSQPEYEEFEVSPSLKIPITLFNVHKIAGLDAAKNIRKFIENESGNRVFDGNLARMMDICERAYFQSIPDELRRDIRQFFQGLLDNSAFSDR